MPNLACGKSAIIKVDDASTWDNARDATTGTASEPTTVGFKIATSTGPFDLYRIYFAFDTSAITMAPTSAVLKLFGTSGAVSNNFYAVKGNASSTGDSTTAYVDGDFDELDFTTAYSSEFVSSGWAGSSFNEVTLNAAALSDMATLNEFRIVLVAGKDYDDDGTAASTLSGPTMKSNAAGVSSAQKPLIVYVDHYDYAEGIAQAAISSDFSIVTYQSGVLSNQYERDVEQVPFILGVHGPLTLRGRQASQVVVPTTGKKEIK
jgi:hypothetical protein